MCSKSRHAISHSGRMHYIRGTPEWAVLAAVGPFVGVSNTNMVVFEWNVINPWSVMLLQPSQRVLQVRVSTHNSQHVLRCTVCVSCLGNTASQLWLAATSCNNISIRSNIAIRCSAIHLQYMRYTMYWYIAEANILHVLRETELKSRDVSSRIAAGQACVSCS